ncbi:hypothetical protein HZS_5304, partial [Henneguya salminicola]
KIYSLHNISLTYYSLPELIHNFDSTFKSVLEIFYQLFVIRGKYNNVLISCAFASMEQQTEIMCRRVWEKWRENRTKH